MYRPLGCAYLQLWQPVFTLGLLALLRPSLEAEWELEEDIRRKIYAEWRGRSVVRWHASPASGPSLARALEIVWLWRESGQEKVDDGSFLVIILRSFVVAVAVVVAVTGAAAVVVGVAVWQMLGAQHQGTSLAIAMRGGGRWRREGEGGGRRNTAIVDDGGTRRVKGSKEGQARRRCRGKTKEVEATGIKIIAESG